MISGYERNAEEARQAIQRLVAEWQEMVSQDVHLDPRTHARIIGARGKAIRKLMEEFKVRSYFGKRYSLCELTLLLLLLLVILWVKILSHLGEVICKFTNFIIATTAIVISTTTATATHIVIVIIMFVIIHLFYNYYLFTLFD